MFYIIVSLIFSVATFQHDKLERYKLCDSSIDKSAYCNELITETVNQNALDEKNYKKMVELEKKYSGEVK